MTTIDIYLLRPGTERYSYWTNKSAELEAIQAFNNGSYEYSFSLETRAPILTTAAEEAYEAQGNNWSGSKIRKDRQSMSKGDIAVVSGIVYVCASAGFVRVPDLDTPIRQLIAASWDTWTQLTVSEGATDAKA